MYQVERDKEWIMGIKMVVTGPAGCKYRKAQAMCVLSETTPDAKQLLDLGGISIR